MDVSSSVEMGVLAGLAPGIVRLGRSIRLRVLQLDADISDNWSGYDVFLQTEKLVRLLPDGNDDAGNMSNSEYEQTGLIRIEAITNAPPRFCNNLLTKVFLAAKNAKPSLKLREHPPRLRNSA